MFSTTTIIAIQMVYVKHLPIILAIAFFLPFGFFDGEVNRTRLFLPFSLVPRFVLGSSVEEGPTRTSRFLRRCRIIINRTTAGRMGSTHVGHDRNVVYALLDMGQGTEACTRLCHAPLTS